MQKMQFNVTDNLSNVGEIFLLNIFETLSNSLSCDKKRQKMTVVWSALIAGAVNSLIIIKLALWNCPINYWIVSIALTEVRLRELEISTRTPYFDSRSTQKRNSITDPSR